MSDYIPYLIFGLVDGSIYGLAAMGLVLTYKTSGVFNFGHGALAAASAFVFYVLHDEQGMPWQLAAFLSIIVFGGAGGLLMERYTAALSRCTTQNRIVGTVGLLVALIQIPIIAYGPTARNIEPFLPQGAVFHVNGIAVSGEQFITAVLGLGSAVGLAIFFTRTRLGTAMRGVVDDPALLDMIGQDPGRVRRRAWLIGNIFASMSGVLLAIRINVDGITLGLLVIAAFGAATFGAFRSLPLAYAGGLVIGLVQAMTSKLITGHENLQGLDLNIPFIILFIGLLVIPKRKLVEVGRAVKPRPVVRKNRDPRLTLGAAAGVGVFLLLVPALVGTKLPIWNGAIPWALIFLSLGLLVRTSGQVSLCQVGFAAVGAAAFAHLSADGLPWIPTVLLAGLIAAPIGALIAIPAIRLSGLYLGLATLGFGVLLAQFFYGRDFFFGRGNGYAAPRPSFAESDKAYYYVQLAILAMTIGLVLLIERSRLGRILRGLADSPVALTTAGLNVSVSRVLVFSISAFMAGIAGATLASLSTAINGNAFPYLYSIIILAVYAISGRSTVWAALTAALLYRVVPGYISNPNFNDCLPLIFGVLAMLAAVLSAGSPLDSERFAQMKQAARKRVQTSPVRARRAPRQVPARSAG